MGAATARAAHLLLDGTPKIFVDSLAQRLVTGSDGDEELSRQLDSMAATRVARFGAKLADEVPKSMRSLQVLRYRYCEDRLVAAIDRGITQYVVLGAGLDSFALRRSDLRESVHVFELDLPATQEWKRDRLNQLGLEIPPNLTFVPVDFESQTLRTALVDGGFLPNRATFVSWLGVTQYLTLDSMFATLADLRGLAPGSEVTFTFVVPDTLLSSDLDMALPRGGPAEPFLSSIAPVELAERLREMGFVEVEHFGPADANARYFAGRNDGLRMPNIEHLMSAVVPAATSA